MSRATVLGYQESSWLRATEQECRVGWVDHKESVNFTLTRQQLIRNI